MTTNTDSILHELLFETLKEQKRRRRWSIFFKILFFLFLFLSLWLIWPKGEGAKRAAKNPHTALIDVHGVIDNDSQADADDINSGLEKAFKDVGTKGIILRINSPGGSPVQASYVYNDILRLRNLHPQIKVYAVCGDICTSAAYYMASATNQIYANPASLVGSIGVLIDGFGFTGSLDKLGVDRRLLTSGAHKGFLDPFSPLNQKDIQLAQVMLDQIHQQFIADVKKGRGSRLKVDENTFSGLAWTGQQALASGLIDGYGSPGEVARDVIKAETIVDYTKKPSVIDQFAQKIGASLAVQVGAMFGLNENGVRSQAKI